MHSVGWGFKSLLIRQGDCRNSIAIKNIETNGVVKMADTLEERKLISLFDFCPLTGRR